jgi:hypothetical protein
MPNSIKPVSFECSPEGAYTQPLSLRASAIAAAPWLDFNLPRKRRSVLPLSCESRRSRPPIFDRRSCGENLVEIMKLFIDIVRIRNWARHFRP